MLRYEIINKEEIPENLPPGQYTTKVTNTYFKDDCYVVELKYLGEIYDPKNPSCLVALTKHDV